MSSIKGVVQRIKGYNFDPIKDGLTLDRHSAEYGVADLQDDAWHVRMLAVRDLIRLGGSSISEITAQLCDDNPHVRHVCALVLGVLGADSASEALQERLLEDPDPVVRSQAAISLGQIGQGLSALKESMKNDPSRDVQHQCELAIYQIEHGIKATSELADQYAALDERTFEQLKVDKPALDFSLQDAHGKTWRLADFRGKQGVVLIWIFADWCPVCHNEFHELIKLEQEFVGNDIQVFTLECHDLYRCRVMVGAEDSQPKYWFADRFKEAPQKLYAKKIWWPHLADVAGVVGARYGVQPMEYVVHSEWINRSSTVIVDQAGIVRLAYYGSYWGDRPTIEQTLEMAISDEYHFEPPPRRKPH